jgi:hypothetical protein
MAALRSRAAVAIEAGSLFNSESLVRSIEKAYRLVFERASNEQAPSDLDV